MQNTVQTYELPDLLNKDIDDVDKLLPAHGGDIQLDFRQVQFITVEALEWLEEFLLRSESMQIKVRFVNMSSVIYKVFKVVHIDRILQACGAPVHTSGPVC